MRRLLSMFFMLMLTATSALALQIPDKKIQITVGDRSEWYQDPMWIAIGVLAIVILLLIVLVARRGGTTVIKR
jgi:uncharacterized membrane protein